MRIISGKNRGVKLFSPKGDKVRPTEDYIKENVFNLIDIKSSHKVLDLFAGSGQIGIEFFSRGCKEVYFSDIDVKNIECIRKNLDKTGYENHSVILRGSFERNLKLIFKRGNEGFDFIFLDPPYDSDYIKRALKLIKSYDLLKKDGMIIIESTKMLEQEEDSFKVLKEKKYKDIFIYILTGEDYEGYLSGKF